MFLHSDHGFGIVSDRISSILNHPDTLKCVIQTFDYLKSMNPTVAQKAGINLTPMLVVLEEDAITASKFIVWHFQLYQRSYGLLTFQQGLVLA